jgi:hypothetical protein
MFTVQIWISDKSRFRVVKMGQIPIDFRNSFCLFRMVQIIILDLFIFKFLYKIIKTGNWTEFWYLGHGLLSLYRTIESLVFKVFQFWRVWYSDPHCIFFSNHTFCYTIYYCHFKKIMKICFVDFLVYITKFKMLYLKPIICSFLHEFKEFLIIFLPPFIILSQQFARKALG